MMGKANIRLMFSLTAHEQFGTLSRQLQNVLEMCPSSQVVLHLNQALWTEVSSNARHASRLSRLLSDSSVIVNPDHLETRWAHMFHAHVSNINLIMKEGCDYDRLVLLSSGDIVVRPGLEEFASEWDIVVNDDTAPDWPWQPKVDADPIVKTLQSLAGVDRNSRSAHEGSFYNKPIVERMVSVLNELISDWNYNDTYPKEEVFFPTLSGMFPDARRCSLHYHHLEFQPKRDYYVLSKIFEELGLIDAMNSPVLARWAERGLHMGTSAPYIVSRVPRRPDSLLRMMLDDVSPEGASERGRAIASRLRFSDIAEFDKRARWPERLTGKASHILKRLKRSNEPVKQTPP